MYRKEFCIILIYLIFTSCGFTPSLKIKDLNPVETKIHYQIGDSSYIARDTLRTFLKNTDQNEAQYIININVIESESAVNIGTDGSVIEYKIEVLIEYEMIDNESGKLIHKSQSRGFSNYDVSSSEYSTELVKQEAIKIAIDQAAELMKIMTQSQITKKLE